MSLNHGVALSRHSHKEICPTTRSATQSGQGRAELRLNERLLSFDGRRFSLSGQNFNLMLLFSGLFDKAHISGSGGLDRKYEIYGSKPEMKGIAV